MLQVYHHARSKFMIIYISSEIVFEVCLQIMLNLALSPSSLHPTCNWFYRIVCS